MFFFRLLLAVFLSFILLSCGGSDYGSSSNNNYKGDLLVTISGLPVGSDANVTISGPNDFSQSVTATTTLNDLDTGTYTIIAGEVSENNETYIPDIESQTVTVVRNQQANATVNYGLAIDSGNSFPSGLAITSPTDTVTTAGVSKFFLAPLAVTWTTSYADAVQRINDLLNGTTPVNDAFTPQLFFNTGVSAECYGPSLLYEDHPDAATPNSGELPGGDLMIWNETDTPTGHACAPAQLNSRLNGIKNQSFAALMGLASMIYVAIDSGYSEPAVGSSLDLTSDMNAYGITGVTFTSVIAERVSTDEWQYTQEYSYIYSGTAREISVVMSHTSGASEFEYNGLLQFTINGDSSILGGGNCPDSDRTLNGSFAYERSAETSLSVQSRIAILCGADATGFVTDVMADDYGQVDPDNKYNATTNPDGWSENFNIFGMEMNPNTLEGTYAYVWQAGLNDSHSRIFLMGVNYNETGGTSILDGEAYAGFGNSVENTDGNIQGMICNWAGPNNSHALQPYGQRQFFSLNETTGIFESGGSGSNITYAPTNSCSYDGSGSFIYDTDLDGDLTDEVALGAIAIDLMNASDTDADGTPTMQEAIEARGYTLPAIPGGFPNP
ncbi:hypothetical protein [Pleionea sediminis]|uniref:hypothetical protein n=1 Tax=Pleionea sediminis TaxID=2569479 RepID=UPI001186D6AA|nr:hypothetical protein [Pleionea sediminis]